MKAVVIDRYGGNEVLQTRDLPRPAPGSHEVLIKVNAGSINPVDWKIRAGMTKIFTGFRFPKVLGSECAGRVVETGSSVTKFRRGDHVIVFPGIRRLAAFAEYACAAEKNTFPKPKNISFEQAAAIPVAGLTALQALRDLGRVTRGSSVLINGAGGGVGHFAVQIAKVLGAKVTGVCSSSKMEFVKELGSDSVIDYTKEDFSKIDEVFDVVFDTVSKRTFSECKRVLTARGIYINTLPAFPVLLNQFITGFFTRKRAKTVMVRPNARDMEWMKEKVEAGAIRITIERVYALENAKDAFAHSETGRARGKIILKVGRDEEFSDQY